MRLSEVSDEFRWRDRPKAAGQRPRRGPGEATKSARGEGAILLSVALEKATRSAGTGAVGKWNQWVVRVGSGTRDDVPTRGSLAASLDTLGGQLAGASEMFDL